MSYEWTDISTTWLAGAGICLSPEQVVAAFNACEDVLGHAWVERVKAVDFAGGSGSWVTLAIANIGAILMPLRGSSGFDQLAERLRTGDRAAFSEAAAA
jgi:hypothetical protein